MAAAVDQSEPAGQQFPAKHLGGLGEIGTGAPRPTRKDAHPPHASVRIAAPTGIGRDPQLILERFAIA